MKLKSMIITGASAVLLTACAGSYDIDGVKNAASKGNAFQQGLHKEYSGLAVMERDEADWTDAEFFNSRAQTASMGKSFGPQNMNERNIPSNATRALSKSRARLMRALDNGGGKVLPQAAARAQAMFDCWMQEQEENNQPDHIRACRQGFHAALFDMKVKEKMMAKMPAKMPMKKMAPPARMPAPYVVYFGFDSADITESEMVKVKQAYADYRLRKPGKILVAGHTDSSGDKDYNLGLSRHRAAEVGNRLMELGVPRKIVKKSRFGEIAPVVESGDSKREGKNRRVTIMFLR